MPIAPHPLRSALLSLGFLSALSACPSTVTPTPPTLKPQVSIHMPQVNVVGEDLTFSVHVSGCETLQTVEIYDGSRFIKSVPPALPETPVTVVAQELDYSRGFALSISFIARAVCSDGRENLSRAQAATYMPVERVFTPPIGEQFVTDLFVTEGQGDEATFLGCTWNANRTATSIVRVTQQGDVQVESPGMPFDCTHNTIFSDVDPTTGKRWVWDPAGGAVAVDMEDLTFDGRFLDPVLAVLVVPGSGDAVIMRSTPGLEIRRIPHEGYPAASLVWQQAIAGVGLIGLPAITAEGVFVPMQNSELITSGSDEHISVSRLDLATGDIAQTTLILHEAADAVPYSESETFHVTMRADGKQIYVPHLGVTGTSTLRACSTEFSDCSVVPGLIWESELTHPEWPTLVYPYANGTRVVVVSNFYVTILDAATGNQIGKQISPHGAQFFSGFTPGRGEAFYLLTNGTSAHPGSLPSGIIAVDTPVLGPVFRYSVVSGSLAVSVAEDGLPWMRFGSRLVKPLPLSDYRTALENETAPGE